MKRVLLSATFGFVLAGCASDVANRYYASQTYAPKAPAEVEVLYSAPARQYVVIADLQGRHETATDLRAQAAQIGADAVIITPIGGYASLSTEWAGKDPYSDSYSHIVGTAIKYK